mgnify:CR=1 FL=1
MKKLILLITLYLFSSVSWAECVEGDCVNGQEIVTHRVTGPDGRVHKVEGPRDASPEDVVSFVRRQIAEEKRLQDAKKRSECAEYSEEAATEWAYRIIRRTCFDSENTLIFRSKEFECALEAGEAKIERAARDIYHRCIK